MNDSRKTLFVHLKSIVSFLQKFEELLLIHCFVWQFPECKLWWTQRGLSTTVEFPNAKDQPRKPRRRSSFKQTLYSFMITDSTKSNQTIPIKTIRWWGLCSRPVRWSFNLCYKMTTDGVTNKEEKPLGEINMKILFTRAWHRERLAFPSFFSRSFHIRENIDSLFFRSRVLPVIQWLLLR